MQGAEFRRAVRRRVVRVVVAPMVRWQAGREGSLCWSGAFRLVTGRRVGAGPRARSQGVTRGPVLLVASCGHHGGLRHFGVLVERVSARALAALRCPLVTMTSSSAVPLRAPPPVPVLVGRARPGSLRGGADFADLRASTWAPASRSHVSGVCGVRCVGDGGEIVAVLPSGDAQRSALLAGSGAALLAGIVEGVDLPGDGLPAGRAAVAGPGVVLPVVGVVVDQLGGQVFQGEHGGPRLLAAVALDVVDDAAVLAGRLTPRHVGGTTGATRSCGPRPPTRSSTKLTVNKPQTRGTRRCTTDLPHHSPEHADQGAALPGDADPLQQFADPHLDSRFVMRTVLWFQTSVRISAHGEQETMVCPCVKDVQCPFKETS